MFDTNSSAGARIREYARLFEEYHMIIYARQGFKKEATPPLFLYPTNSRFYFLRPFDAFRIGIKIIRERGINLVSVQDPAETGVAGWLLKKALGTKLHIQIHADFFSPFFKKNSLKEYARYLVSRFIIPRGDKFRVVSQRIADSLHSTFHIPHSKIKTLPIFVDRGRIAGAAPSFDLRQKYPQFDFIILMVARLVREKNIGFALIAFKELVKEFSRTGMVIVGDGPEFKNLQLTTNNLQLGDSVRFEGWQNDLVPYYKGADLYLLTSSFEGYGRSVIEAVAAGLPVVMTDVGVAGEIIRDKETGLVVPPANQAALAKALSEAHHHYNDMRRMAERAYSKVSRTPPLTRQDYLRMYKGSFSI